MKKVILIFAIIISVFIIYGCDKNEKTCEEDPSQDKCVVAEKTCEEDPTQEKCQNINDYTAADVYVQIEKLIPNEIEKGDKLQLPDTMYGYDITYSINKTGYFSDSFEVIFDENYEVNITITINITSESGTFEYVKSTLLLGNINYYFEMVENYLRGFITSPTRKDLRLKTQYYSDDVIITYKSSNTNALTDEGKYVAHEYDENVELTCTLERRGHKYSFVIDLIVTGIPDTEKVVKVTEWLNTYSKNVQLADGDQLPTTHPQYGGRIRWICENPLVVYDTTTVHLPLQGGTYYFIAEVYFPAGYSLVRLPIHLNPTKMPVDATSKALEFIKNAIDDECNSFINLYAGSTPMIDRSLLIDTEGGVKNIQYTSNRPSISQSVLDERIYKGFTLDNDANIMWIVVHETGIATTGKDALVMAQYQDNKAYGTVDRDSSWHFSVDDGKIYQSFEENIACWHASDSSRTAGCGNANGIGIEMCVNPDGNYDASMRNNASLIASLLIKYNLGMLNVDQHYTFDGQKNCPEKMRNNKRWFEFLSLIAKEYASQTLLANVDVSYNIIEGDIEAWKLSDIYYIKSDGDIKIEVSVNNQKIIVTTKGSAKN